MKKLYPYAVFILVLCGCDEQINTPASKSPVELWRSHNIHNYSIEQIRFCFCGDGGEKVKVIVQSDIVFSVMRLSDSVMIQYPASTRYLSIDSMFSIIQFPQGDSLVTSFNSLYGYPEKLDINPQLNPVDGGVMYQTSRLTINK